MKFAGQSPSTVRFFALRKGVFELSLSHLSGICFLCLRGVFYTANFFFHRLFEISAHTTREASECCGCFNDRSRFHSPCLHASTARLNALIRSKEAMYRRIQFSTLHLRLAKGLFQLAIIVAILPIYVFCTTLNR